METLINNQESQSKPLINAVPTSAMLDGTPKKKNYFLWILAILALAAIFVTSFLVLTGKSRSVPSGFLTQPSDSEEQTAAADDDMDISNWKTYTNSKYSYSIEYPSDKFTSCKIDEFFLQHGPDDYKYNCYLIQSVPDFNITINSSGFGYDREVNNECYSVTSQNITLSGIQGKKYAANKVVKTPECSGKYPLNVVNTASIILDNNGNKYTIFYFNSSETPEEQKLLDKILSTFKFMDSQDVTSEAPAAFSDPKLVEFVRSYLKMTAETQFKIEKVEGDYAYGTGGIENTSGFYWAAAKKDGEWNYAFGGNGIPDCSEVEIFPIGTFKSAIGDGKFDVCYNESRKETIYRLTGEKL